MLMKTKTHDQLIEEARALLKNGNWADTPEGYRHWATKYNELMCLAGNEDETICVPG
jgi:hypothetical protein